MVLISFKKSVDLSDCTLILPTVSVGNVPQLTVDLLITTYNFSKVATIWHPGLVPLVGPDPYFTDKDEVCTACDMYYSSDLKWVAIQMRSTLELKLASKFLQDLRDELVKMKIKKVVILSSGFDYELRVNQEKFYAKSNSDIFKISDIRLGENIPTNGCGFSFKMYNLLSEGTDCLLLVKFVSEGDNKPDAVAMLEKLLRVCHLGENKRTLVEPSSWRYAFGSRPPVGIF